MFVNEDDYIEVKLFHKTTSSTLTVRIDLEEVDEEDRKDWKENTFFLKQLTWKMHNDLQKSAIIDTGMGQPTVDWVSFKENRLKAILKKWDATDKDGKPIPVNDKNIAKLHQNIAETLLDEYDKRTILGEEERKN